MNRRSLLGLGAAAAAAVLATGAEAQQQRASSWDGTWTGTTERGGSVVVVVSGNRPVQYVFRGVPASINSAQVSGNTLTMTVGQVNGKVTLQRRGNQATYTYSDAQGGTARATLNKS